MQGQSTSKTQRNARALRCAMTDSERRLWIGLRGGQLGARFRRQHPLGTYVADFACLDLRLIVELDGSQHQSQVAYDARRDAFFRAQGFEVLRFDTHEPLRNLEGVLTVIDEKLKELGRRAPTPTLPQRGREKDRQTPSPSGGGLGWGHAHPPKRTTP